jgi:hypothetical protein
VRIICLPPVTLPICSAEVTLRCAKELRRYSAPTYPRLLSTNRDSRVCCITCTREGRA